MQGSRTLYEDKFVLETVQTKRIVGLQKPWPNCMLPSQKKDMSMIMRTTLSVYANSLSIRNT